LGWQYESLERHQRSCPIYLRRVKAEEEYKILRRNTKAKYNRILNVDIQSVASSMGAIADSIKESNLEENEARYSSGNKAILEAFAEVKASFARESDYERKHRYKQIESIKDFANTVLYLYDKLEAEVPEQQQIVERSGE
jgi:hypothetical protein